MTGPVLTRAEQRAFVLALLDVPVELWWWDVARMFSSPVWALMFYAAGTDDSAEAQRECIHAAADLLRPRWTRDEADEALTEAMKNELLRLMHVESNNDWGPSPIVCRWCGCWLRYGDRSAGRPVEEHETGCFAVAHLGRPSTTLQKQAAIDAARNRTKWGTP